MLRRFENITIRWIALCSPRAETKPLIGGGGAYSYIRVLPDEFLLKSTVMTTDFKRNSSGRTRIHEYAPPPPINALVSALCSLFVQRTPAVLLARIDRSFC